MGLQGLTEYAVLLDRGSSLSEAPGYILRELGCYRTGSDDVVEDPIYYSNNSFTSLESSVCKVFDVNTHREFGSKRMVFCVNPFSNPFGIPEFLTGNALNIHSNKNAKDGSCNPSDLKWNRGSFGTLLSYAWIMIDIMPHQRRSYEPNGLRWWALLKVCCVFLFSQVQQRGVDGHGTPMSDAKPMDNILLVFDLSFKCTPQNWFMGWDKVYGIGYHKSRCLEAGWGIQQDEFLELNHDMDVHYAVLLMMNRWDIDPFLNEAIFTVEIATEPATNDFTDHYACVSGVEVEDPNGYRSSSYVTIPLYVNSIYVDAPWLLCMLRFVRLLEAPWWVNGEQRIMQQLHRQQKWRPFGFYSDFNLIILRLEDIMVESCVLSGVCWAFDFGAGQLVETSPVRDSYAAMLMFTYQVCDIHIHRKEPRWVCLQVEDCGTSILLPKLLAMKGKIPVRAMIEDVLENPGFGWWVQDSYTTVGLNCGEMLFSKQDRLSGHVYWLHGCCDNCLPCNGVYLAVYSHKSDPGLLEAPD